MRFALFRLGSNRHEIEGRFQSGADPHLAGIEIELQGRASGSIAAVGGMQQVEQPDPQRLGVHAQR